MNCHEEKTALFETPTTSKRASDSTPTKSKPGAGAYTAEFDAFWAAYGRKGSKARSFKRWRDAVKVAPVEVIMRAVPAYVASTGGPIPRFRLDAENWLSGECWESAVVPASTQSTNGRAPYQNPADESVWDKSL